MLDFIINPIAGGKHGKKTRKTVAAIEQNLIEKGVEYKIHFTRCKGHAKEITSALIEKGATDIIVVGGDGSLHEVINGFHSFEKVNLGLIPCGTGNDFASATKIPLDVNKALDIILKGTPKYTDFIQLPGVRGINVVGTGIDVDVLKRYEKLKKKNKFGYTMCLIKTLFKFDYTEFDAAVDGQNTHYRSFIAAIANGNMFGGGLKICPIADPGDGKLNLVTVSEIRGLKLVRALLKLKSGKLLTLKQASTKECLSVSVSTKQPCTINIDGELYENIPFQAEIVSNTLKMYRN